MMTTNTITIRTDSETADKLNALAKAMDRSRNWVVEDALKRYIAEQTWQIEGIEAAIESLDKGNGVAHDVVTAKITEKIEAKLGKRRKS